MEELVAERILLMQGCDDLWDELTMLKCLLPFLLLPSLDPVLYWVIAACHLLSGLFKLAPNFRPGQTQNVLTCVESSSSKSLVLEHDSSWQTHPFPQSRPHKRRNKIRANFLDQTELFVLASAWHPTPSDTLPKPPSPWAGPC